MKCAVKNCQIEIRLTKHHVTPHNKKYKSAKGAAIKNLTQSDLLIADINWSYDVERNVPFSVSGHYRMQPCGPSRSKLKLIWVEAFQKKGYKRKAGKRNV